MTRCRRRKVAQLHSAALAALALQPRLRMLPIDIAAEPPPPIQLRDLLRPLGIIAAHVTAWSLLGFVGGAIVLGLVVGPQHTIMCGESKVDIARYTIAKLGNEAYPQWLQAHPDRVCPTSLRELAPYMDRNDIRDPWGREYQFTCGDRLYVMSLGEDGHSNTGDDIWSHEP